MHGVTMKFDLFYYFNYMFRPNDLYQIEHKNNIIYSIYIYIVYIYIVYIAYVLVFQLMMTH